VRQGHRAGVRADSRAGLKLPVLVLTARDAVPDHIRGLDLGADDYVVKPVDLNELAARLRTLVGCAHGQPRQPHKARMR
jgi:two-component system OmpR family response regulator/two-component system response regulator QseB